ncbi:MAG: M23 family metallopeptidase [Solirubrobacterales bacterium]
MLEFKSSKTFVAFALAAGLVFGAFYLLGSEVARVSAASGGLTTNNVKQTTKRKGVFPVKARVSWGDSLGAGRGHQGQDLMASCGKKIVAARTGRVKFVDYQAGGAGHYAVIRGTDSRFDYVYMHMIKRPKVKQGQKVKAGKVLGYVGSTGRSSACHLHFEMWTRPGWYKGGDVKNPRPHLKSWRRAGN